MSYARYVGLAPTKTSSSQATWSYPGKAKSYEPKALNETMLSMRRKKSITISTKEKENMRKRGDPHQKQGKVNKRKNTREKLKENKIIKSN